MGRLGRFSVMRMLCKRKQDHGPTWKVFCNEKVMRVFFVVGMWCLYFAPTKCPFFLL